MIKYYRKTLTSLFQSLNDLRTNPANIDLCFSIQEKLLNHIRRIEYQIRKIKSNNSEIQNLIKNGRFPKEESRKLKQQIEYNILKKNSYDRLLLIFRDVGDGIAFTYLDKWYIKPLCVSKETAGFISRKKGIRLELAMFRKLKRSKFPFIFCDITNSVRYSDIVVVKHGIPLFFEIKSGKSSASNKRALRQKENIQKIAKYLITDEIDGLYGIDGKLIRRSMVKKERDHRSKLNVLLEQSISSKNDMMIKVEKGLYYAVIREEGALEYFVNKLPKHGAWVPFHVNEEKKYKEAYYPFTLSINDPESLFEFYKGEFSIIIFIDFNEIAQICSKYDIHMEFYGDYQQFMGFVLDQEEEAKLIMSHHLFGRIYAEFLSLKWITMESCNRLINSKDFINEMV